MTVGDFLLSVTERREPWNCSTMPADWCVALGHPDFAAPWRDVTDPADCDAIADGDLLTLWGAGIGNALPVVSPPYRAGDIAVIAHLGLQAGAIFTGERWALQTSTGFAALPLCGDAIVKAWRP